MGSQWGAWDDMPPLVDANAGSQAPRVSIPPPPGATMMPTGPAPHTAPQSAMQLPWSTPFPNYPIPSPHDQWAAWRWYYENAGYPQQSGPSPYLPRQSLNHEMSSHDPFSHMRRTQSQPNPPTSFHLRSNTLPKNSPWPSHGDLSPLDISTEMPAPDVYRFAPHAPDMNMNTPSSTLSRSISTSAHNLPRMNRERPQQWRHDFKFKSGFASMLRSWSSPVRSLDDSIDSAKLDLHPLLRYSRSRPLALYDLRREPVALMFRELSHPPLPSDMNHSVTRPPTQYMRLYHSRLPWYIDIRANGAPFISLADFFQQLYAALNRQITKYDFYNNELDDEDREALTRTFFDRCCCEEEKMEGVKQVDFLRGKCEWLGIIPGKNGMWRLRTG